MAPTHAGFRSRWTYAFACFLAELFGTGVAVFIGASAQLVLALSRADGRTSSHFGTAALAWVVAFMAGNMLMGHISGGHFNPVLTIAFALVRRTLSIPMALIYVAGQMIGGFLGAGGALFLYRSPAQCAGMGLDVLGPFLYAGPVDDCLSRMSNFMTEFVGTVLLVLFVCSTFEGRPHERRISLKVAVFSCIIIIVLGYATGPTINPATDTGPRLVSMLAGEQGVWDDGFWWYGAWVGPAAGALLAVLIHEKVIPRRQGSLEGAQLPVSEREQATKEEATV